MLPMFISRPRVMRAQRIRNFIFGVEDSLVSTVGVLSGVAIANVDRGTIFLTGIVLIFVEAFSMGVGSYLSESSGEAYVARKDGDLGASLIAAVIMFVAYFCSGFIPLSPYIFIAGGAAMPISIIASFTALFILGAWSGSVTRRNVLKGALRMLLIGGGAIALGIFAGKLVG